MLIDGHGRRVDYLRISVTERCNFRCRYCMPITPFEWKPHSEILTFEEMFEFVKVCIDEGVKKIRITGGEPLVRKGTPDFIAMISSYAPDIDLAMTTNGYFMSSFAQELKDKGLKRVNISLDTLVPQKAEYISQKNILHKVLFGIDKALEVGLSVKINTVALKGINDDEILHLLEFAKFKGAMIRYIEFMENIHMYGDLKGLKGSEILNIISKKYSIKEIGQVINSPSSIYEIDGGYKFGIIDPHRHDFCESCNRLRMSASGVLIPCLYFDEGQSIKEALRTKDIEKASEILRDVLRNKPEKNRWEMNAVDNQISSRAFYETGG
ncbi:MAG: GTP 3',8-cyclase MoaA [Campylobacter sp.]|nr:GTP 3',8-cyclase MoaA [Campylobacter sp.]